MVLSVGWVLFFVVVSIITFYFNCKVLDWNLIFYFYPQVLNMSWSYYEQICSIEIMFILHTKLLLWYNSKKQSLIHLKIYKITMVLIKILQSHQLWIKSTEHNIRQTIYILSTFIFYGILLTKHYLILWNIKCQFCYSIKQ